jgi:TusA-related sulfurtransferase
MIGGASGRGAANPNGERAMNDTSEGRAGMNGAAAEGHVDREIDTRGLSCPLPILRAKKALADMTSGQVLKIVATDPGSVRDFQAFARQTGNTLLGQDTVGKEFLHYLQRR